MELATIWRTVTESAPEDWHVAAGDDKIFRYEIGPVTRGDELVNLDHDSHHCRAVYRGDVRIGLEYGLTCNNTFQENWTEGFPDQNASSNYVDITFNGGIVERRALVVVDGGRAILPMPKPAGTLQVSRQMENLARIVHEFAGPATGYDDYFRRAGLTIEGEDLL